jgi:Gluconate 2-dehydrogenase subunit 3
MEPVFQKLTRRQMLERLLAGVTAGGVWPMVASSHPIHYLLTDHAMLDRIDAAHHAAAWKPHFLSEQQAQSLDELAESIIPGSSSAHVNRFIDLLLSVDSKPNEEFVASLRVVQDAVRQKFGRGFGQLTAHEKEDFLRGAFADPAAHKPIGELKEWISIAYYSSEEGMKELGWTGTHAFRNFPGCDQNPLSS